MPSTLQPIIITADLGRLATFYTALLGAKETGRMPEEGATFFLGCALEIPTWDWSPIPASRKVWRPGCCSASMWMTSMRTLRGLRPLVAGSKVRPTTCHGASESVTFTTPTGTRST
jgi:hypothetical protein